MRVFIICNRLCYGGAEHVATTIANGLAERGHCVTLVANLFDEISYPIVESVRLLNLYPSADSQKDKWIGAIRLLREYFKQGLPDAVIGIMWACSLRARLAAIGLGIPVISTVHDSFERPESAPMARFEHFVKFYLNKIYPVVTVLTEADKKVIGKRLKNVVVMPNPLSISPLAESSINTTLHGKQKILLAVGRLDSWHVKGFDILIEAWSMANKRLKAHGKPAEWKLQIAGKDEGGGREHLQKLIREYHVDDSIEFLGFRKDVENLFRQASIFVLSSRYEGFGLVLIEAMSQGCACIAADYKGRQSEIFDMAYQPESEYCKTSNGILIAPDHPEALAKAIEEMITDSEYRRSTQTHAVERVRAYSVNHVVDRWEKLIKEMCHEV